MPYKFNPFTGTFDDSTTGPQGATGTVSAAGSGTAAAPGIAFASDPNTGIYNPSADNIAISTGGTGRLFVGATGFVGMNTGADTPLNIKTTAGYFRIRPAGGVGTEIDFSNGSTNATTATISNNGGSNELLQFNVNNGSGSGNLIFNTVGSERLRIDSSGRLLVGTSSASILRYGSNTAKIEINSVDYHLAMRSDLNANGAPFATFVKTRANAIVQSGDAIGAFEWRGHDGTDVESVAATIEVFVDGTPGTNDMPGRLVFSVTADGAASSTERMRITSTGQVRLAGAGITFNGDTAAANELDDYEEGTWTPVISGASTSGTGTYTVQSGRYTKVGRSVYVAGTVAWTAHDGTGTMRIAGLPFTSLNVTELANAVSFTYFSDIAVPASSIPIGGTFPNTNVITIYSMAVAGGTPSGLAMDNSGTIYFSMNYQAA